MDIQVGFVLLAHTVGHGEEVGDCCISLSQYLFCISQIDVTNWEQLV